MEVENVTAKPALKRPTPDVAQMIFRVASSIPSSLNVTPTMDGEVRRDDNSADHPRPALLNPSLSVTHDSVEWIEEDFEATSHPVDSYRPPLFLTFVERDGTWISASSR